MRKSMMILLALAMVSCEGGTTFKKSVNNQSSETVTLVVFHSVFDGDETFVIPSGKSEQIYFDDRLGLFVDENYACTNEFDSILVTVSGGKTLIKSIMDSENWERDSKDGRNSMEDCSFTITNNDLE